MSIEKFETNSFLAGANIAFVEELYARFLKDPILVDVTWQSFFSNLEEEAPVVAEALAGPSWAPRYSRIIGVEEQITEASNSTHSINGELKPLQGQIDRAITDSIRALMLVRAYRVAGHLAANLDPLGIYKHAEHPELDFRSYGFDDGDLGREIYLDNVLGLKKPSLQKILTRLQSTYCGTVGVEFMHIQDPRQKLWIQERIEAIHNRTEFTQKGKETLLKRLTEAETFENFLNTKYPGTKRFGLDGGESLIPAVEQVLKRGSQLGIKEVVIGMPHRGRLSVLAHVMQKPYAAIIAEFQGNSSVPEGVQGSGDVKYHLGTSADVNFDGKNVHLSLSPNPSHLEAVDPVIAGRVRGKQRQFGDWERKEVLGLVMHGDAAFAGQGLVAECLDIADVKGYRTGGTIHFIVNNQIGFTTNPAQSRSTPYPSFVAKGAQAPIFHVNGDDVEATVHVARIATEFRQEFQKDVVIDMWCYRRFGHNEGDEPAFTQPQMYNKISNHASTRRLYAKKLTEGGDLSQDRAKQIVEEVRGRLEDEFEAASTYKTNKADWLDGKWSHLDGAPTFEERRGFTEISRDTFDRIGHALVTLPEEFQLHPRLKRVLNARKKMVETGDRVDWAMAEALAFGTLVDEGYLVRLSGQDVQRGTFSQRHAHFVDQVSEEHFVPLSNISDSQEWFAAHNSPLSEAAILGFEYGYSLVEPDALVCWEAQFGDFANGAQVIIDQFISSAESKWLRMSGIVMLLPHGYEGQGPEHSSARLERYLQICGEDNIQVCIPTTPASYFHLLRRQLHRKFRKPLIVMTPKSLLRHKLCVSSYNDFGPETYFRRVLPEIDQIDQGESVERVILCSGKVYYDLLEERRKQKIDNIAVIRIEQLYPFPTKSLAIELKKYTDAEVIWCQEEPKNMGAWTFVDRRIEALLAEVGAKAQRPRYIGRDEAASPATGSSKEHLKQQRQLVNEALLLG